MSERHSNHFDLKAEELQLLKSLEQDTALIIVPFGSVYSLACFSTFKHVMMPYEDDPVATKVVPQIIFCALSAKGKLPVSIPGAWEAGQGIRTEAISRLGYAPPLSKSSSHNTSSTASAHASADSYGHSGFTGTAVWVDPRYDLVYVFLSNRTYPDAKNNRLSRKNVRRRIHDAVYESIKEQAL
jgi:hypothetical protein